MAVNPDPQPNASNADPMAEKIVRTNPQFLDSLKALDSTGRVINKAITLPELGRAIIENALQALAGCSGHILLLDYVNLRLETLASVNLPSDFNTPDFNEASIFDQLVNNREPVYVRHLGEHQAPPEVIERLGRAGIAAFVCLPLLVQEQILGLFFINYSNIHYFNEYEKQLLNIFANQAATAILNSKVMEQEREAHLTFESLVASARLITSQTELTAVLQTIITRVTEVLKRPGCSLGLMDDDRTNLILKASIGLSLDFIDTSLPVGRGFTGTVAATGQKWEIYDFLKSEFVNNLARQQEGWRSGICLPLKYNGQVVGTLSVYDRKPGHFSETELAFLEGMAAQACIAINNARVMDELRRQRDKYQALLENAGEAILLVLPESGKILEANLRAAEMLNYPAEKLIGRGTDTLFVDSERRHVNKLLRYLRKGEVSSVGSNDLHLQSTNGTSRIVNFNARLVEVGGQCLIVQIIHDLTEQRAMEQQLVRLEQLKALGQLASGVAHDFNNVLTAILGLSDLVLADLEENTEQRRLIEVIRQSALDGAHMVQRIQFLGTKNHGEGYVKVDLSTLLRDVIELTRPRWRNQASQQGIRVEVELEVEPVPPVLGSPAELREVLTNLIFNALDAMPEGGKLLLKTFFDKSSGRVWVVVRDTGTGMTEETRQRLFEPFFTTKVKDGHGLGLSVSWSIISRHGGTIEVDSNLNDGTSFTIKLPAVPEEIQAGSGQSNIKSETMIISSRKLRALVVDDEENLAYVLTRILGTLGHSVKAAFSGTEALQILENDPQEFDIVFTDLSIPDIVGWEIARAARKINPDLMVVLVTGWGADLDQQMLDDYQINLVINKPYRVRDVQKAIATLF
jgi:PAS domain S-box-containing protein